MDTLRSGKTEALLGGREKWTARWKRAAMLTRGGGGQWIHCGVVRRKHCWVVAGHKIQTIKS